jgi:hypothetical protein
MDWLAPSIGECMPSRFKMRLGGRPVYGHWALFCCLAAGLKLGIAELAFDLPCDRHIRFPRGRQ